MKLKKVVLNKPLPRESQPTAASWAEVTPSAQWTSERAALRYDPATGLVYINARAVHISQCWFIEPDEDGRQPMPDAIGIEPRREHWKTRQKRERDEAAASPKESA